MSLDLISLTPREWSGIPVALVGSALLAIGAHLQHKGISSSDPARPQSSEVRFSVRSVRQFIRRPIWLLGTAFLGVAIVVQLFSLYLSPLSVVQPLGALALVVTAILNARSTGIRLSIRSIRAISLCVGGIGLFVVTAASTTSSAPIDNLQLLTVLILLAATLGLLTVAGLLFRQKLRTIYLVVAAGVLFGFVATLAKVVIDRVSVAIVSGIHWGGPDLLTVTCVLGLGVAAITGSYLVQTAYSTGSAELVVAGLTVIDPLVGVTVGLLVLNEAASAPGWAWGVFILTGAVATYGVVSLAGVGRLEPSPVDDARTGS